VIAVQALDKRSFRLQHNRTPGRKLAAIPWTQQAKQSWARFTGRPVLLRLTTSRHSKCLTNYLLDFEPLKTGYESLRQKSGITRTEQTGPRSGCIKSRLKLSRDFSVAQVGRRASRRLSKHFPEVRDDRPSKLVTCNSIREYCKSGNGRVGATLPSHFYWVHLPRDIRRSRTLHLLHIGRLGIARLLIWVQNPAVRYKGIRYTIRVGIEREQWFVAIHPAGVDMPAKRISGRREHAESLARSMINGWLAQHPTRSSGPIKIQTETLLPSE
jgi:hypothetical protein